MLICLHEHGKGRMESSEVRRGEQGGGTGRAAADHLIGAISGSRQMQCPEQGLSDAWGVLVPGHVAALLSGWGGN